MHIRDAFTHSVIFPRVRLALNGFGFSLSREVRVYISMSPIGICLLLRRIYELEVHDHTMFNLYQDVHMMSIEYA